MILTRPILALNCRLQVEQVNVMESTGDPLALRSVHLSLQVFVLKIFAEVIKFLELGPWTCR